MNREGLTDLLKYSWPVTSVIHLFVCLFDFFFCVFSEKVSINTEISYLKGDK